MESYIAPLTGTVVFIERLLGFQVSLVEGTKPRTPLIVAAFLGWKSMPAQLRFSVRRYKAWGVRNLGFTGEVFGALVGGFRIKARGLGIRVDSLG